MTDIMAKARHIVQTVFGFPDFVSIQADVIAHVMAGRDALCVMPTGGGKSICYQVPALLFDGLTVVVSPLISLMNDQMQQLRQNGVAAVVLNSALNSEVYRHGVSRICSGDAKLLYVAPETLLKPGLLEMLDTAAVCCLAIDEAHCISEWGHDFRPEYRRLAEVRTRWPNAVCLALTATATVQVRRDIQTILGFDGDAQFIAGFDRPNLFLRVAAKEAPYRQTLAVIRKHARQPGIIYCATRRQVALLSDRLAADGIAALPYHAGMSDADRDRNQARFSRDDAQVMVATVAFGMGIDKSNIRFVVHHDLPKNIESYYQEIGRAGRDGAPSDCLLLFGHSDIYKIKYMISRMAGHRQRTANVLLTTLLRYVETVACRRIVLLDYFGETYTRQACGMCDNCTRIKQPEQDLTVAAQKLLSCVKRTGEIFGVVYVIDVLRGAKSRKILGRGHQRLSTYGIGTDHTAAQWRHLARQLLHNGFMAQDMNHGGVRLTAKGWHLLRGECVFSGTLPDEADGPPTGKAAAEKPAQPTTHDTALFEQLRLTRKTVADQAGIPPFMVFSDKTLMEMSARFPQSKERLLQINGVGLTKAARYGDCFLETIRDHCTARGIVEPRPAESPAAPTANADRTLSGQKRRFVEIGEAFNSGIAIADLMARYAIKRTTVITNLNHYWQAGRRLRHDALAAEVALDDDTRAAALSAFHRLGHQALRPIHDALNQTVPYDDLQLLRLYYLHTRSKADPAQAT